MDKLLNALGLMRVSEHEKVVTGFMRDIREVRAECSRLRTDSVTLERENNSLRPDAEAMRAKRARDREQKAAKARVS